jgi:hypothetical protein
MHTLGDKFHKLCDGKVRHPDAPSASREALRMQRLERKAMNAYHCPCCGQWHVGTLTTIESWRRKVARTEMGK